MEPSDDEKNGDEVSIPTVISTEKRSKFKRGWVVVAAAFCVHIAHSMQIHFTAVILTELAEHFRASSTVLGTLAALRAGVLMFAGVPVAPLVPVLGCRLVASLTVLTCAAGTLAAAFCNNFILLTVFFAVVASAGTGSMFIPTSVIVQQHFSGRQRALAAGLASAGLSLGSIVSAPLLRLFITWYGWRGCFVILAGITLQMLVFTMLFFPPEAKTSLPVEAGPDGQKSRGDDAPRSRGRACAGRLWRALGLPLLKNKVFIIFLMATCLLEWGTSVYIYLGISRAVNQGIDVVSASFVNSAFGPCSMLGRVMAGVVGSAACANRKLLFSTAIMMAGLVEALSILAASSFTLHLTFAATFGFFFGMHHSLYPTLATDLVGTPSLPSAMGLVQLLKGIASLICLQFVGWLIDFTGGYLVPFLCMGAVTTAGGLVALLMIPLASRTHSGSDSNSA